MTCRMGQIVQEHSVWDKISLGPNVRGQNEFGTKRQGTKCMGQIDCGTKWIWDKMKGDAVNGTKWAWDEMNGTQWTGRNVMGRKAWAPTDLCYLLLFGDGSSWMDCRVLKCFSHARPVVLNSDPSFRPFETTSTSWFRISTACCCASVPCI